MRKIPEWMLVSAYLALGCALQWTDGRWLAFTQEGWVPLVNNHNRSHPGPIAA
jgi:hypothetical protein